MLPIYDKELARDTSLTWYFTNQTFDFCMLANSGVSPPMGDSYCTLAMDWLHNENRQGRHGLKETTLDYTGAGMEEFNTAFPGLKEESTETRILRALDTDFRRAISYASDDAYATFRVFHILRDFLAKEEMVDGKSLWDYFQEVEMPFTRVLFNMIRRGIMIDTGYLEDLKPQLHGSIQQLERKIVKMAGKELNLNSTKQMAWLLFEKLGLKPISKTKKGGKPSTDVNTLQRYADDGVEICEEILKLRKLTKFNSTYVEGLSKWLDPEGRIHATLTQHVTVTGRLSSSDPNLQNLPRPDNDVFCIRDAFMPREGYTFLVLDYDQLEMKLLAHESQEQNMIDVINRGWDIHTGTASLMYNYPYESIIDAVKKKKKAKDNKEIKLTDLELAMCQARQDAKSVGFGLNYGEGPKKLAHTLGCSVDEAKRRIEKYFLPYPAVREFINDVHRQIRDRCMVSTLVGRPRRFPEMASIGDRPYWDLSSQEKMTVAQNERQSVNSIIQGGASDVAKKAMLLCEFDPQLADLGVEMLLQIHDELIFEVPVESMEEAMPIIKQHMEHPLGYDLSVQLTVGGGIGNSWAAAKG
jgi:DNA polymerase-1